ncbi:MULTISPECIES: hypothetical protein [Bacillus]|uniref:hypothetical protein n=1 Tax=Bacillus TaxID=1386 RepID=UPI001E46AD1E|nr:hypothetical protein [Bacillus rhizoplanae]
MTDQIAIFWSVFLLLKNEEIASFKTWFHQILIHTKLKKRGKHFSFLQPETVSLYHDQIQSWFKEHRQRNQAYLLL